MPGSWCDNNGLVLKLSYYEPCSVISEMLGWEDDIKTDLKEKFTVINGMSLIPVAKLEIVEALLRIRQRTRISDCICYVATVI